jgi:hypothetical protein
LGSSRLPVLSLSYAFDQLHQKAELNLQAVIAHLYHMTYYKKSIVTSLFASSVRKQWKISGVQYFS